MSAMKMMNMNSYTSIPLNSACYLSAEMSTLKFRAWLDFMAMDSISPSPASHEKTRPIERRGNSRDSGFRYRHLLWFPLSPYRRETSYSMMDERLSTALIFSFYIKKQVHYVHHVHRAGKPLLSQMVRQAGGYEHEMNMGNPSSQRDGRARAAGKVHGSSQSKKRLRLS